MLDVFNLHLLMELKQHVTHLKDVNTHILSQAVGKET